ncbi:hypothetical protein PAMA_012335 [Pampus argenteus]
MDEPGLFIQPRFELRTALMLGLGLSSRRSALDFINTLFDLASSQYKPKYSMELAEALNHAGSSWKDPEGAEPEPAGLRQAVCSRGPGLSLTPSWWRAYLTLAKGRPHLPSAHQNLHSEASEEDSSDFSGEPRGFTSLEVFVAEEEKVPCRAKPCRAVPCRAAFEAMSLTDKHKVKRQRLDRICEGAKRFISVI